MDNIDTNGAKEKSFVAMTSIIAAVFLTLMKLTVGLMTGSLGILSEALHSGLDLVAAVMTFFAVRIADKPADEMHNYGHGKIENLSALFETGLLLITCVWIVYEAVSRLSTGNTHIEVNGWSFAVIIVSIVIDITRSRALMKTAKKYNSQALEADALHFSTDIASSAVVLVGLAGAYFNLYAADAVSALIVAVIVIWISYKMGKKSIAALMDSSPKELIEIVNKIGSQTDEINHIHDIRVRTAGADVFVEANIHINPNMTVAEAHEIAHALSNNIKKEIKRCHVHIHIEPEENRL